MISCARATRGLRRPLLDTRSEGQSGDFLGPDGVMLQRWKEKALVGRHVSLLLGMGDE
jgi:hypothetical protein